MLLSRLGRWTAKIFGIEAFHWNFECGRDDEQFAGLQEPYLSFDFGEGAAGQVHAEQLALGGQLFLREPQTGPHFTQPGTDDIGRRGRFAGPPCDSVRIRFSPRGRFHNPDDVT